MTRRRLTLLTVSHVVTDFYTGAVPAILPFLVVEREYSYAAISGITMAATLFSSIVQPLFGVITDRRRMAWMVITGMLVAGVGIGLSGIAPTYLLTCVVVAVSGIGVAAYHPEGMRQARDAVGYSAAGLSVFSVGGNAGRALAPLAVAGTLGWLGTRGTPLLVVPALLMAVWFAVDAARRRRSDRVPQATTGHGAPATSGPDTVAAGSPDPAPQVQPDDWKAFRRLIAVVMINSIQSVGIGAFIALYFVSHHGQSTSFGSSTLTVLAGVGVGGTLFGGWLADRIGRVRTVRIAYAASPFALAAMVLSPSLAGALAALVVLGFAVHLPFSVQVTLGHEYLPNRIGTASGVTLGLGVTVGGAFAPLLGLLADAVGIRAMLLMAAGLLVVAFVLSLRLTEPERALHPSAA